MKTINKPENSVAILLNVYKRGASFEKQLAALNSQTIKPSQIFVWKNAGDDIPQHLRDQVILAECNKNLGVWARLAFALNIDADYICMFDDDTIPGPKWLENCLSTIKTHNGLLGTRGIRFMSKRSYSPTIGFGWSAPNPLVEQVDIVGHSWFFRREWLAAFWAELPPAGFDKLVGEDIHFSFAIQKHLGLKTYVPPHPPENPELWGSIAEEAISLSATPDAIALRPDAAERFNRIYLTYIQRGFEPCLIKDSSKGHIVLATGLVENTALRNSLKKYPFVFSLAKKAVAFFARMGIHI